MKPDKSRTIHNYDISRSADCEWPDLPWPEWKPKTDKTMRPDLVRFTITVYDDGKVDTGWPTVHGRRVNKAGLGADVSARYYSGSEPDFVKQLLAEARADLPL